MCYRAASTAVALLVLRAPAALGQNLFFGSAGFGGSQDALYTTDLNGSGLTNILGGSGVVSGVAADGAAGMVFWKDPNTGGVNTLHAASLSGGSHSVIATWGPGLGNNYGVAADRLNQRVYWTDTAGIKACNYNGTGATSVLVSANAEDVEVDPGAGKILWTDNWGNSTVSVWIADLNGSNPRALVTFPGNTILSGLAVNPLTQTVFWSDYLAGTVSSLGYAGGTPTTILSGHQFPAGLEYESTSNRLYVVSKGLASVGWMSPAGGPLTIVFTGGGQTLGEMWDIAAVAPAPGPAVLLAIGAACACRRRR